MEVVTSLSQGRTAAAQCGLFTYKSVPVIFEPPFTTVTSSNIVPTATTASAVAAAATSSSSSYTVAILCG